MRIYLSFGPRLRFLFLIYGICVFFWLSLEDHSATLVTILGSTGAIVLLAAWIVHQAQGRVLHLDWRLPVVISSVIASALLGAVAGAVAVLMTVFLMFLKTALHSHLYPDYPLEMMQAMLTRLPVWSVAGGLIALAFLLLALTFCVPFSRTNPADLPVE